MTFAVQGCSQDTSSNPINITELEGNWESACLVGFSSAPISKLIRTYNGDNLSFTYNTYTDTNCTNLESSIDANLNPNLSGPDGLPTKFLIGNQIISANGVTVKEIDYITKNNIVEKSIYLLQNNATTMYLALPCTISPATCIDDRPTEISYLNKYTKIN